MNQRSGPEHGAGVIEHVAQVGIDTARNFAGETALLDQFLIKQAVVALNQHLIEQAHGVVFR